METERKKIFYYFAIIALILSAAVFLFIIDTYRGYESRISIILIPKSEKAAENAPQIAENLRIIPTELSFYNKLLKDNQNIQDNFKGLTDSQREKMWNGELKTRREKNSSIINISVKEKNAEEARNVSKGVAFTIFNTASFYYDIKNDIDLRIIDGPIIEAKTGNLFLIVLISLISGALASLIISLISGFVSRYFSRKIRETKISFPKFDFRKKTGVEIPAEDNYFKEPEKIPETAAKTASAPENLPGFSETPENLPFVDEEYFRNNIIKNGVKPAKESVAETEIIPEKEAVLEEIKSEEDLHREPTKEELKKRLNQLLRGEL